MGFSIKKMKIVFVHFQLEARGGHVIFSWGSCKTWLHVANHGQGWFKHMHVPPPTQDGLAVKPINNTRPKKEQWHRNSLTTIHAKGEMMKILNASCCDVVPGFHLR